MSKMRNFLFKITISKIFPEEKKWKHFFFLFFPDFSYILGQNKIP